MASIGFSGDIITIFLLSSKPLGKESTKQVRKVGEM
jgi:hypothetical protein